MKPQYLTYVAIAVALSDSVLAYGDQVSKIPGVPGWLAHAWPFILILAGAIHQVGSILNQHQTGVNTNSVASVAAQTGSTLAPAPPLIPAVQPKPPQL